MLKSDLPQGQFGSISCSNRLLQFCCRFFQIGFCSRQILVGLRKGGFAGVEFTPQRFDRHDAVCKLFLCIGRPFRSRI